MHHVSPGHRLVTLLIFAVVLDAAGSTRALADDETPSGNWPKVIQAPEAAIIVYQPQIEEFAYDILTARAAVSVTLAGKSDAVFGAVWFSAHVRVDRDTRMVYLISLNVTDVKFPDAKQQNLDKLAGLLKQELTRQSQPVSLDRILTALEAARKAEAAEARLSTTPPRIFFRSHPAVLISIDGKPELRPVENSKLKRVINTPFLIIYDPTSTTYYLRGGADWWKAKKIEGAWTPASDVPAEIASLVVQETPSSQPATPSPGVIPEIIVATEPAELVVVDSAPKYAAIENVRLLYISNTENDVFLDPTSKTFFVLLSGRWFSAIDLNGPWSFVPGDKLPPDFAKIPENSPKADVLAHIPGTQQADEALHEACIPQTAEIDRKSASVQVQYDGSPQFKPIDGTTMHYAVNTPFDIIKLGDKYYCCNEGVWFSSDSPTGPWVVCAEVPETIYTIPPECPVYPVTYVYVYDSTPTTVCVGYTAGYVGCYAYHGAVVYGTGFRYVGWSGGVYWARPATWGFNVRYNSVTGNWGFHAGYAGPNGWIAYGYRDGKFYQGWWAAGGWHTGGGGWWGHGGYHDFRFGPDIHINNLKGNEINVANRVNIGDRNNIYNRSNNVNRLSNRTDLAGIRPGQPGGPVAAPRPAPLVAANLKNDVYADRNGNIFRHTDGGWQQRVDNTWNKPNFDAINRQQPAQLPVRPESPWIQRTPRPDGGATPGTGRPSIQLPSRFPNYTPPGSAYKATPQSDLNRQFDARQRGDYRTNTYQQFRSSGGSFGGGTGGGFRGGGGGRGGRR